MPEWAPNAHPIVVHFPIALLTTAVAVDLVSLLLARRSAIRHAATWLYSVGAVFAILAYVSGENAADGMLLPAQVAPLVSEHEDWALWATALFTVLAAARVAAWRLLPPKPAILRTLFVAALAGVGLLFEAAEHGGQLVYEHGLGVQAITADESVDDLLAEAGADPAGSIDPGIIDLQDGSWVWRPAHGGDAVLAGQFTWLLGDAAGLSPAIADDPENGPVLSLHPQGPPALLVAGGAVDAAQADVRVNLDQFDGELQLVLHVQDEGTFDFFAVDGAAARLGRMDGGERTVFEEQPLEASGWLRLRLFGGDGHFRGYVNGELAAHGHTDDLPPGRFGLRVEGAGTLLVDQIQVQAVTP